INNTKNIASHSLSQMKQLPGQLSSAGQNLAIKGAGLAGNVYRATNPLASAAIHGFQKFQQKRTPQEPVKAGQVINPFELGGRSNQALPYSGRHVRYHGVEPEMSSTKPKTEQNSGFSSGLIPTSSMNPVRPKQQAQSSKQQGNNQRKPLLNKGSAFVGQSIPLPAGKVPVPQLTASGSLSQQIRQVKNQAKNGSYPAMQQLLNQYSVPKSSIATLSGNRSVQQLGQRSSESKPSISAPKSLQPAFSSLDKPTDQSKKIEKDPKTLPILDAKPGTDFTLPKGRTVQKPLSKKG
ncbi:hypothetical protein QK096_003119, partial [Enterococcus faecalis]|nr:hypothetical protein [Enterococcus faecalis]